MRNEIKDTNRNDLFQVRQIVRLPNYFIRKQLGRLQEDIQLTKSGDSAPGIEGLHGGKGFEGDIATEHAGEVESCCLDKVSGCGKHGNTGVLDLRSTEPRKGGLRSQSGKVERIPWANWLGVSGHIIENSVQGRAGCLLGGRGKGSGRTGQQKNKSRLHHCVYMY